MSWGTKGSDKADALPALETKKDGKGPAVAEVAEAQQEDLDAAFEQTVKRAIAPFDQKEEVVRPTRDDENKTFRTRVLTVWLAANAAVSVIIMRANSDVKSKFFIALLWTTCASTTGQVSDARSWSRSRQIRRLPRLHVRRDHLRAC